MNPRIEIDPQIQHGRPVIKGTRVPVIVLLRCIASEMSQEEIAQEYHVEIEDVRAALDFAMELVEKRQRRTISTKLRHDESRSAAAE